MILYCSFAFFALLSMAVTQDQGYFWQLTDLHYDPWYTDYSRGSCNVNLTQLGQYGDFECDPPWSLVASAIGAMKQLEDELGTPSDFILLSGDHSPHVKGAVLNESVMLNLVQNITNELVKVLPNTLVLPVLGNHDYWPKNQHPAQTNSMYQAYADMWGRWINTPDAQETFRRAGYYALPLPGGGLAVSLNTNLDANINAATAGHADPGGQFEWLTNILSKARRDGEKVLLFLHIPTGAWTWAYDQRNRGKWIRTAQNFVLMDVIREYADVITASFSCHTHADTFGMYYDNGDPVHVTYISPSITPWRYGDGPAHNPALRKVVYSKTSFEVLEIQQYYLDLKEANENQNAVWKHAYKFTTLYNLADMSPASLHGLLERMKRTQSMEFDRYYDMNTVNTDHYSIKKCDCTCKAKHLCSIEYINYADFDQCFARLEPCSTPTSSGNRLVPLCWIVLVFLLKV